MMTYKPDCVKFVNGRSAIEINGRTYRVTHSDSHYTYFEFPQRVGGSLIMSVETRFVGRDGWRVGDTGKVILTSNKIVDARIESFLGCDRVRLRLSLPPKGLELNPFRLVTYPLKALRRSDFSCSL